MGKLHYNILGVLNNTNPCIEVMTLLFCRGVDRIHLSMPYQQFTELEHVKLEFSIPVVMMIIHFTANTKSF